MSELLQCNPLTFGEPQPNLSVPNHLRHVVVLTLPGDCINCARVLPFVTTASARQVLFVKSIYHI